MKRTKTSNKIIRRPRSPNLPWTAVSETKVDPFTQRIELDFDALESAYGHKLTEEVRGSIEVIVRNYRAADQAEANSIPLSRATELLDRLIEASEKYASFLHEIFNSSARPKEFCSLVEVIDSESGIQHRGRVLHAHVSKFVEISKATNEKSEKETKRKDTYLAAGSGWQIMVAKLRKLAKRNNLPFTSANSNARVDKPSDCVRLMLALHKQIALLEPPPNWTLPTTPDAVSQAMRRAVKVHGRHDRM